jgi:hypothetical protein
MAIPYVACMVLAAKLYGLPPRVLPAVQLVEGGRAGSVVRNDDGSADLGVMQVNTRWLPGLAAYIRLPQAVVRERLISQPCFSVLAAAAILRSCLNDARGDLMLAIGNYHSHNPPLNRRYQIKVLQAAALLFQRLDQSKYSFYDSSHQ